MKISDLKFYTVEREKLEKAALQAICACYFYDLADCLDETSDEELEQIVANNGVECQNCATA